MNDARMNMLYERMSAMQKCIRRSMVDDAGFWFFAMCEEGFTKAALNRLRIIAHEDIGTAAIPELMFALRCIDDAVMMFEAKNDGWRLPAANAVMTLAQCPKSRAADTFQCVCRGRYIQNRNKEIPDFAYDKHTRKGRKMGRGFDHFFKEGAKLVPEYHDPWEKEAITYWMSGIFDKQEPKPEENPEPEGEKNPPKKPTRGAKLFLF
jgi:replication-associated recombination protein RarA